MPLGGGTFLTRNKVMPGAYINFVSSTGTNEVLGNRGVVAIPLELDWGPDESVFTITSEDFEKTAKPMFGYNHDHDKLKGIRDLFRNAVEAKFYRLLNSAIAASCTFGTAKCKGVRGNDISIIIAVNVDDNTKFDVTTVFDGVEIETQTVTTAADLSNNDYIIWNTSATLAATAGTAMTGGTNGVAITGTEYQAALDAFEAHRFDVLGCLSTDDTIKDTFVAYTKRLRDGNGVKFQTVVYRRETADYEGVISVENNAKDTGYLESSLVYFVSGACAGGAINASITNKIYDGEFTANVDYTQTALETAIGLGKLMLHSVGDTVRILSDINTLTTYTAEKTEDFSNNQTVRVIDQVANDIAHIFNTRYLGLKPNDNASRIGLWNELVTHHKELESLGAIESFNASNITVEQGEDKKTVIVTDYITPTNAMEQLYMTVIVQ